MLVYKYLGAKTRDRDLSLFQNNHIWASSLTNLNDPAEGIIYDILEKQALLIGEAIGERAEVNKFLKVWNQTKKRIKNAGIYCVSKNYDSELMWAHYAESHKGICIEFDFQTLINLTKKHSFNFEMKYQNAPPKVTIADIMEQNNLVRKILGYKSKSWKNEDEVRILVDDPGEHPFIWNAIKSIHFGIKSKDEWIADIMNKMKGRGINYYKMKLETNSYKLKRERIEDQFDSEISYLNYPIEFILPKLSYRILKQEFHPITKLATVIILIDDKVSAQNLSGLARMLYERQFPYAERMIVEFKKSNSQFAFASTWLADNFKIDFHGED